MSGWFIASSIGTVPPAGVTRNLSSVYGSSEEPFYATHFSGLLVSGVSALPSLSRRRSVPRRVNHQLSQMGNDHKQTATYQLLYQRWMIMDLFLPVVSTKAPRFFSDWSFATHGHSRIPSCRRVRKITRPSGGPTGGSDGW